MNRRLPCPAAGSFPKPRAGIALDPGTTASPGALTAAPITAKYCNPFLSMPTLQPIGHNTPIAAHLGPATECSATLVVSADARLHRRLLWDHVIRIARVHALP